MIKSSSALKAGVLTTKQMSHFHKKTYKENQQLIPYINGFLGALEILNVDANHGQTYYVEEIERLQTYEKSIAKHLCDDNYKITIEQIIDWKEQISETAKSFFGNMLHKVELTQPCKDYAEKYGQTKAEIVNFDLLIDSYTSLMDELITERATIFEVFVDWSNGQFYECYHKDYLVDNDNGLFFIHFGTSD